MEERRADDADDADAPRRRERDNAERYRPTYHRASSQRSAALARDILTRLKSIEDPDLEAKFRRMLATPEGREAVDAERARAERLVDRRERERYEAWRRRRRRQSEGGGFLSTLATLATLPLKVSFGVIRWGWNRWRRRPEAAGDGSDVV